MSMIKRPPTMMMAPPGSHVVKRHVKISSGGIEYYVKAHTRKNRGKKATLLPENLLYLYWLGDHDYPALDAVKGFDSHRELDNVIQFWLNFWREQGLPFPDGLDPFLLKVLIAVESSFRPTVKTKSRKSSATGLMQLLQSTLNRLEGIPVDKNIEVKDFFLQLSLEDLKNPVINIAAGIRWLSHKYNLIVKEKKIRDKDLHSTIKYYHSWDKEGEAYADKIFKLYKASRTIGNPPILK